LNILRARLYTGKSGLVVDKILVSNWRDIWWHGMEAEIKGDLREAIGNKQEAIIQEAFSQSPTANRLLTTSKRFESFIEIDNETSDEYTILELFSPDRLGLLYDISARFYMHNAEIISAIINTEDGLAQDVFYLQHKNSKLNVETIMKVLNSIQSVIFT
jgi:[protein-PII] uridylyltransferase